MKTATNKTRSIMACLLLISLCCSIFLSNFEIVFALEDQMRYTVTIQETEHGSISFAKNANYEDVYKDNVDKETVDIPMNIPTNSSAIQNSSYTFSVDENGNIIQNETGDNANYTIPDQIIDPSCKKITKGDNVILNVLPDENYVVENIYVLNEKGKAVNYAFKDNKISFIMPRSSVSVKVLFTNKLSDITPDDSIADNYTYIVSNLNKDYVNFTKWETINLIKVKQTVVESTQFNEKNLDKTIDNFNNYNLYDSFINFKSTDCKVYNVDDNSDYYIAFVDTMHNDESEVTDYCVANYNNNGEVLENNYYDYNTGILYIKKEYVTKLNVNDESTFDKICNTQIQLLNVFDKNDELDHKVQLIINDNYNILNNESSIINNDQYDNTINIKLLANSTEVENIDINIKINDIYLSTFKLNETVDTNSFSFNSTTNVLSIYSNMTISINSIELETINNENNNIDFIDTALAGSLVTDFDIDKAINHPSLKLTKGNLNDIKGKHIIDKNTFTFKQTDKIANNTKNITGKNYIFYPEYLSSYQESNSNFNSIVFTANTTANSDGSGATMYVPENATYTARLHFIKSILGKETNWNYTYATEYANNTSALSSGLLCYTYGLDLSDYSITYNNTSLKIIPTDNRCVALLECLHVSQNANDITNGTIYQTLDSEGISGSINANDTPRAVYFKVIDINTDNNIVTWAVIINSLSYQGAVGVFKSKLIQTEAPLKIEKQYLTQSNKEITTINEHIDKFYTKEGTRYSVYTTQTGGTSVAIFESDKTGKFFVVENNKRTNTELKYLPVGTYYIIETNASTGFDKSGTTRDKIVLTTNYNENNPYIYTYNNTNDTNKNAKDYEIYVSMNGIKVLNNDTDENFPNNTTINFSVYYSENSFFNNDGTFKYGITPNSNKLSCTYNINTNAFKVATATATKDSNGILKFVKDNNSPIKDDISINNNTELRGPLGYYLITEDKSNNNSVLLDYHNGYPSLYTAELLKADAANSTTPRYIKIKDSKKWTCIDSSTKKFKASDGNTIDNTYTFNISNPLVVSLTAQKKYNNSGSDEFNNNTQRTSFYSSFINNYLNSNYSLGNAEYNLDQKINGNYTTVATGKSIESTNNTNGLIVWKLNETGKAYGYTLGSYSEINNAKINDIPKGTELKLIETVTSDGTSNSKSIREFTMTSNLNIRSGNAVEQNVNVAKLSITKTSIIPKGSYLHRGTTYTELVNDVYVTKTVTDNEYKVENNNTYVNYKDAVDADKIYFNGIKFEIWHNPKCSSSDNINDYFPQVTTTNNKTSQEFNLTNINSDGNTKNDTAQKIYEITLTNDGKTINYIKNNNSYFSSYNPTVTTNSNGAVISFDKLPIGAYAAIETKGSILNNVNQPIDDTVFKNYINNETPVSTYIFNFYNFNSLEKVSLNLRKTGIEDTQRYDLTGATYEIWYQSINNTSTSSVDSYTNNIDTDIDDNLTTTDMKNLGFRHIGTYTIKGIKQKETNTGDIYKNLGVVTYIRNNKYGINACSPRDLSYITSDNIDNYTTFTYDSGIYILVETKGPNNDCCEISKTKYKRVLNNTDKDVTIFKAKDKDDPHPETFTIRKTTNNKQETLKGTIFKIDFFPGTANLGKSATQSFTTQGQTRYTLYFGINKNTTTDEYTLNLTEDNFLDSDDLENYGITVPSNYDDIKDDIFLDKYGNYMSTHHIGNSTPNKDNVVSFYQGAILITEVKGAPNHDINTEFEVKFDDESSYRKIGTSAILNSIYDEAGYAYIKAYIKELNQWKTIVYHPHDTNTEQKQEIDIELIKDNPIGDPFSFRKVDYKGNGLNVKFKLTEYLSKTTNDINNEYNFETTNGYIDSTNNAFSKTGGKPLIKDRYYVLTETSNNTGNLSINIPRFKHIEGNNILDDLQAAANSDTNMAKAIEALIVRDSVTNSVIDPPTPKISSKVKVDSTGSNIIPITRSKTTVHITDTISYENLAIGNKYQLHGIAMDVTKNPPEPMKDANGNVIIKHGTISDLKTSAASNYEMFVNGTTNLAYEFAVDESTFAGKTINFYTYLTVSSDNSLIKINKVEYTPYNYAGHTGSLTNISGYSSDEQSAITNLGINSTAYSVIFNNGKKLIRDANKNNVNQTLYTLKVSTNAYDVINNTKTASIKTGRMPSPTDPNGFIEYPYVAIMDNVTVTGNIDGNYYIQSCIYDITNGENNAPCLYVGTKDKYYIDFDNTNTCTISTKRMDIALSDNTDISKIAISTMIYDSNKKLLYSHNDNLRDENQKLNVVGEVKTELLTNDSNSPHMINLSELNAGSSEASTDIILTDNVEFKRDALPMYYPKQDESNNSEPLRPVHYEIHGFLVEKDSGKVVATAIDGFVHESSAYAGVPSNHYKVIGNDTYIRKIKYKFNVDKNGNIKKMYNTISDTSNRPVAYNYQSDPTIYGDSTTSDKSGYFGDEHNDVNVSVSGKTLVSIVYVYINNSYETSKTGDRISKNNQLNDKFRESLIFGNSAYEAGRTDLYNHYDLNDKLQSVIVPGISTYAYNTNTKNKYIDKNSNSVNITDEITCVGLPKPAMPDIPAKTYYAFGVILNKNGDKVIATASKSFEIGYNDDEKQVSIEFNNINVKSILSPNPISNSYYQGTNEFIIYEYIFKDSSKVPTSISAGNNYSDYSFIYDESVLLVHKDNKDEDQTLIATDLKTVASYSANGSKLVPVSDTLGKVTDKSTATLIKNNGYRIIGYLVDTTDNKVIDKQSKTFTAVSNNTNSGVFRNTEDIVFTNSSFDLIKGDIYVDFNFNSYIAKGGDVSALKNHNLVVYEYLYKDTAGISWGPVEVGKTFKELTDNASVSRLISKHYDKNDANQRVQLPEIRTTAVSTNNSTKVVFAGTSVNISDTVKYSNLIVNDEYRLCGYIVDKSTHKIIARASSKFTASAANSNFTLAFSNVNASNVSGKELVIYEYLYSGGDTFTWPQNSVGSIFSADNIINDASYSRYLTEHVDDNDKDQTLYVPEIYTNAVSTEFGGHLLPADKNTTIKDIITYKKLISDDWYRINGYLVDTSNNKIIDVQTKTFQPDNTKSKTPVDGSCSINYSINTTDMGNHTFVIYEYVYTGNGAVSHGNNTVGKTFSDPANAARLVGKHYDRNDRKQTVYVPLISTTANNDNINDHLILANNSAEIVDTISYNKLIKNNTYRYYGFIVNKENNKILTTKTGTFKASGTEIDTVNHIVDSGTVKVTFSNIDLSNYEGKTFVIYEYVFNGSANVSVTMGVNSTFDESKIAKDTLIAKHYAPNDFDQQIGTVKIGTQAINTVTNNNLVLANGQASIKDTVSYTNVLSNTGYHILGYLVDLDDANKVIAKKSVKFNSKTTTTKSYVNGTVEVPFTFDASNLAGHRLVVYEYLYYSQANVSWGSIKVGESFHELTEDNDSAAYKRLIAIHKNDEDEKQNVYVVKVGTTASNNTDNIKLVLADTNANIIDSVHCQNLIQGQGYRLCGYLIDKDTNIVVRKITKTFTASSNTTFTNMSVVKANNSYTIVDGYVNLNFNLNASDYENKNLVVYEYLYMSTATIDWSSIIERQTNASVLDSINSKDRLIGIHAERDDEGQTIYVPKARTTASVVNSNQRVTPDENGSQKVRPDASVELKDTISYNNLLSNSSYTAFGYLIDINNTPNDTSDDKLIASQRKTFTSKTVNTVAGSNGSVDLNFIFDARKFAGKSVVIYEYIYTGNVNANAMTYKPNVGDKFVITNVPTKITNTTGTGVLIAKHADSTDRKQTIVVTMPIEFIKKDYDNNILAGATLRFSKVNNVDMNNLANIKPDDIKNNSLTKLAEWVTTTDFYRYEDVEEGIYIIEEIHASKSHAIVIPVYITVRKDAADNNMLKAYYTGTNEELGRHNDNTQYQSIILYDPELTKLPTAGSTGTLLYTVFGMIIMMGSYYMLKRKKLFEF